MPTAIAQAKASYARCQPMEPFFERFYERFFEVCPAARPMFLQTDFPRQHKLLQHAIGLLLSFASKREGDLNVLSRVALRHGKADLAISADLYPMFVESLLKTVREFDPQFAPEDEAAWREALAPGVAYMQSKA